MLDFEVTNYGSVWQIQAISSAAKEFAEENFGTEGWQGEPTNFMTDHRAGRDLVERLISEGWVVNV